MLTLLTMFIMVMRRVIWAETGTEATAEETETGRTCYYRACVCVIAATAVDEIPRLSTAHA